MEASVVDGGNARRTQRGLGGCREPETRLIGTGNAVGIDTASGADGVELAARRGVEPATVEMVDTTRDPMYPE